MRNLLITSIFRDPIKTMDIIKMIMKGLVKNDLSMLVPARISRPEKLTKNRKTLKQFLQVDFKIGLKMRTVSKRSYLIIMKTQTSKVSFSGPFLESSKTVNSLLINLSKLPGLTKENLFTITD